MANPLLAEAREHLGPAHQVAAFAHVHRAVDAILRYLEQRYEAGRAPMVVPEPVPLVTPEEAQLRAIQQMAATVYTERMPDCGSNLPALLRKAPPPDVTSTDEMLDASAGEVDLDALQALCDAATRGPWSLDEDTEPYVGDPDGGVVCELDAHDLDDRPEARVVIERANGEFIAAARDAMPKLIAEVRRLQAREQRLMPALQAFGIDSITARGVIREVSEHA